MNLPKMTQKHLFLLSFMAFVIFVLGSCKSEKPAKVIAGEEPIIKLAKNLADHDFSIVLHDMDVTEDDINTIYRHKYVSMQLVEDSLIVDSTDWVGVGEQLFQENEENLGMELVSYHGGKMSTVPKPVGFDWAIGNEKYGEWSVDSTTTEGQSGERTWRYRRHGGGHFLFYYWMFSRRTPMSSYSSYSKSYRGRAAYYGTGANTYGTNSSYQRAKRSSFYSRRSSSKTWKSHTKRASRSSSRYKGSSSSRRRSGGIGK